MPDALWSICQTPSLMCEITKTSFSTVSGLTLAAVSFILLNVFAAGRNRQREKLQKLRDRNTDLRAEFFRMYGEFFSIWKILEAFLDENRSSFDKEGERYILKQSTCSDITSARRRILELACMAEGRMEATLLRIAADKPLNDQQTVMLGVFRQAYQELRKRIRANAHLDWFSSETAGYAAMKIMSIQMANSIIETGSVDIVKAKHSFAEITSNKREDDWKALRVKLETRNVDIGGKTMKFDLNETSLVKDDVSNLPWYYRLNR